MRRINSAAAQHRAAMVEPGRRPVKHSYAPILCANALIAPKARGECEQQPWSITTFLIAAT